MSLEDDLRHQSRNSEARQRSIEQLGPVFKDCMMLIMEMDEDELREWRDDVKDRMRAKRRRERQKGATLLELLKWGAVAGATYAATWVSSHWKWP